MSLICHRSSDPNHVVLLYDNNNEKGHLYMGNDTSPLCNYTSPPPLSCVVCFEQFVYTVCSDLQKNVTLVMEGSGKPMDLIKSECPTLLGNATNENADLPVNHAGAWEWWMILLLVLFILAVIISALVIYCRRGQTAVNFRQVNSEAEAETAV